MNSILKNVKSYNSLITRYWIGSILKVNATIWGKAIPTMDFIIFFKGIQGKSEELLQEFVDLALALMKQNSEDIFTEIFNFFLGKLYWMRIYSNFACEINYWNSRKKKGFGELILLLRCRKKIKKKKKCEGNDINSNKKF